MWKTSRSARAKRSTEGSSKRRKWGAAIVRVLAFALLLVAVAAGAFFYGRSQSIAGLQKDDQESLKVYAEALDTVRDDYVDKKAVNSKKQTYGAIEGMLDSLGDEGHTRFQTAEEAKSNRKQLSGKYVGIGVQLADEKEGVVVSTPIEGSPAATAGMKSGDIILAVDGKNVADEDASRIVEKVKGEKGTKVEITVRRGDKTKNFTMERAEINSPVASWYRIPGSDVAEVQLSSFSDESASELSRAFDEARADGAKRFVLDLRNNPGGRLDQAVEIAGEFLKTGKVVYIREDSNGKREKVKVGDDAEAIRNPLVVLVNSGSASSSEILAGALRDNDRAEVVGETTYGTGTVLSEFTLSDGSSILLGVAEWLTPDGDFIRDSGIKPDIKVKLQDNEDIVAPAEAKDMPAKEILDGDDQLRRAFEEVRAE